MSISFEQAKAAANSAEKRCFDLGPVVSIGVTKIGNDFGVRIGLEHEPKSGQKLPTHIDNVPVEILVLGPIVFHDTGDDW